MPDVRPTKVRYAVLAALCAAAAIAYVQRQLMGNAALAIRAERGISEQQMGVLMSSWLWTYAIFQIPAGRLADVWGARRALSLYCAVWSVATMLVAVAPSYGVLYLLGSVFGAAQAGIFPCAAIVVRQWFPPQQRGLTTAFIAAFQQVGGALAAFLGGLWIATYLGLWQPEWAAFNKVTIPELPQWVATLSDATGDAMRRLFHWSGMFVWFAAPGLVWAAWFWRWYVDVPTRDPRMNEAERALLPEAPPVAAAAPHDPQTPAPPPAQPVIRAMLTSRTMWLICIQQFFRGFSYIFYVTWFPTYLKNARGLTVEKSGAITALMFVASLFGALVGGAVSDAILARTGSRRIAKQGMAFASLLGAGIFLASAYAISSVNAAVAAMFMGSFMAALAGPIGYSVTIDISGRETATVFGTMNMSGNIGAALFPTIVPTLVMVPEMAAFEPWFRDSAIRGWDLALFACAGSYIGAAACWLLLNPSETIFKRRQSSDATGP